MMQGRCGIARDHLKAGSDQQTLPKSPGVRADRPCRTAAAHVKDPRSVRHEEKAQHDQARASHDRADLNSLNSW